MNFDLIRPCPHCPFRTDCMEGWLGRGRAREIAQSLLVADQPFPCHRTTKWDEDGEGGPEPVPDPRDQHCAGALLVMEAEGAAPQLARIAGRLGMYDPDRLDTRAPTFGSMREFIAHHADADDLAAEEAEPCSIAEPGCEAPAGYAGAFGGVVEAEVEEGLTGECYQCGEFVCGNAACSTVDEAGHRQCAWCRDPEEGEDT